MYSFESPTDHLSIVTMSNMNASMAFSQFQSVQGPADSRLRHSELEGYQPVSRIGEVVINSFGMREAP